MKTTKKTLKEFLNSYSSNPELHKKVFKAGGVNFEDFKQYPNDYILLILDLYRV